MCKEAEYITKLKELGYCWIPSVSFLAWWKKKKQPPRNVIKMQQQVLPPKTGFLWSPLTLPDSFQVLFYFPLFKKFFMLLQTFSFKPIPSFSCFIK